MSGRVALRQFLRYATVGLVSNAVLYLAYLGLTALDVEAKRAMTLLYVLGVLQTFGFNKRWSFAHGGVRGTAFVRYAISYALGYVMNLGGLLVFVDVLGYPHQIVQGLFILGLAMLLFLLQKYWVFRPLTVSTQTTGPLP